MVPGNRGARKRLADASAFTEITDKGMELNPTLVAVNDYTAGYDYVSLSRFFSQLLFLQQPPQ